MKIIIDYKYELPSKALCHYCKMVDYTITTPSGADYTTCPVCDSTVNFEYSKNDTESYEKYWQVIQ